jgi:hypothetical protein
MNPGIPQILSSIEPYLERIEDQAIKEAVYLLLNLIESTIAENNKLKGETQSLKDEINRLKGEQGKPDIKPNKGKAVNVSSEQERKQAEEAAEDGSINEGFKLDKGSLAKLKEQRLPSKLLDQLARVSDEKYSDEEEFITAIEAVIGKSLTGQYRKLLIKYARYKKRNRQAKVPAILIDRHERCVVDRTTLPAEAVFNGYEYKVVQDVVIKTDNVEFQREVYYCRRLKKTYTGAIPAGYEGDFGPNINSDIIPLKYVNGMSNPKIVEFYKNIGISISGSYISTRLTKPKYIGIFHEEKSEMHKAALEVSSYIQIDDTGTRVNGENHYTQIICNELYTVFFTTKQKDRLTVLEVLRNFASKSFLLNDETFSLLKQLKVSNADILLLEEHKGEDAFNEETMLDILETLYSDEKKQRTQTKIIEACAIISYRHETSIPVVKVLVGDDAPQFKLLTKELALCWVHNGRHYKRLNPVVPLHQRKLKDFLHDHWDYYRKLLVYKKNPCARQAAVLSQEFDTLFSRKTGYADLDERIEKSRSKKEELLVVLKHPEVPLHNNASENGARTEKRRQDVSLQTKTDEGTKAKDTMMSIVETCKKLGISAYKFINDRVSGKNKMAPLAEMIRAKTAAQFTPP